VYFKVDGSEVRLAGSMPMFPEGFSEMPGWVSDAYDWCECLYTETDRSKLPWHPKFPELYAEGTSLLLRLLPHTQGVDVQLLERAEQEKKSTGWLESAEDLERHLGSISTDVWMERLEFLKSNAEFVRARILDQHKAWLSRDLPECARIACQLHTLRWPPVREALIDARNLAWMPKIVRATQSKRRTLIVVNAVHLHGKNGLLELIKQVTGYTLSSAD
jgi:hypothetical protein